MIPTLKIGTRGSPLALVQAGMVRDALAAAHGIACEIVVVRTTGDRIQDRLLAEIGGKALWTKELDRALLDGAIDLAVHSMKDVETLRPGGIVIAAMLERADVRDRLVGAPSLAAIRRGGTVGTSSPRRRAQVLRARPDLSVVLFRGNVDARLARLAAGEADATLLAAAGLERLGRDAVGTTIAVGELLPAPAQGAIGIEVRRSDTATRQLVAAIDHPATSRAVECERALLAALGATCRSPVAALATIGDNGVTLAAELYSEDGVGHIAADATGSDGEALARDLARALLVRAPATIRAAFAG
ncbi:hydroxymethylbilane synthase [uncultured Sphingomonas sp.]|uniref:hydroxymethylbilane synthase n=1 Tax=uncultured Sphingomonas sp. TaxID=158754 RepID=UPI0035CB487F